MLCPMKFNGSTSSEFKNDVNDLVQKYSKCEQEECSWWIKKKQGTPNNMNDMSCCAIKLMSEYPMYVIGRK